MEILRPSKDGKMSLRIDKTIYDREAILKAAYKFSDECYIHIDSIDSNYYAVSFSAKKDNVEVEPQINEFCNELIDQQIRHNLNNSNRTIKELIIKKAFFPFQDDE